MREQVPFSAIRAITAKSSIEQEGYHSYGTTRGITEYLDCLPNFAGQSFMDFIQEVFKDKGKASVLDIGCGEGLMLKELKEMYGNALSVTGFSIYDYGVSRFPQIKFVKGNAHNLQSYFPHDKFDMIISAFAFQHMADPLRVIKSAYRLLSEGGRGYFHLSPLSSPLVQGPPTFIKDFWGGNGIRSEIDRDFGSLSTGSVVIEKGVARNLPMPFRYSWNSEWSAEYDRLEYELVRENAL